jgi:Ca2+-binding EF-hand superfamily protein
MPKRLLFVTMLLVSSCALAQLYANADQLFASADVDHDGKVSRAEFIAQRTARFTTMDRNGDGYIDEQDLPRRALGMQRASARLVELRRQLDANGDGRVSQQELAQGPIPMFERADTNRDGLLDAQEFAAAQELAKSKAGG